MNKLLIYSLIHFSGVLISAISQILLKTSAKKHYDSVIKEYLNPYVICGYGLFFGTTLITLVSLKVIPLSLSSIITATTYIITPLLSYFILKEKMTKKQLIGMVVIIIGVIVYTV